jgi:hypothetical protein
MSADSARGAEREPNREPVAPRWEFRDASVDRRTLDEPVLVPRGVESIEVRSAVVVRLTGLFDPGGAEWYDSFLPTLRVGGTQSSRMTRDEGGVRFTYYPDVDGDVEGGAVEFRARIDDEFEATGLEI